MLLKNVCVIPFLLALSLVKYGTSNDLLREFDSSPENVSAIAGKTAILTCTVDLTDADPKREITWMSPKKTLIAIGDRRIIDDPRMSIERPRIPDWNLHIRHLEFFDRGMYICSLNTKPMSIKNVYLEVYVNPYIHGKTLHTIQSLKEGATANLTCNATGYPEPTITWYRTSASKKEAISRQGSYLMIHNISRYCSGTYECEVFNGIGPAVSKSFSINVHFKPEVQVLNKKQKQDLGKDTILQCEISASPQAIVNWRKGHDVFTANNYHRITSEIYEKDIHTTVLHLRIQNLTWSDFGEYICEASNVLGKDLESMQLLPINGIPISSKSTSKKNDPKPIIFNFSSSSTGHQKLTLSPEKELVVKMANSKELGTIHDAAVGSSAVKYPFHKLQYTALFVTMLFKQMVMV
ncbi:limbic system-associated membrane protein-like isoform X2 [Ostrea edulis]|uniref:limbic system-associated membrane protein-like isoform X2 n=1 Tax=Ostrea edulis TaxID=37623 RepID=UPI0024AFCFD3|nr:limbic system-associated membrane protein-like isoform X2 [Ostrea edulis]